MMYCVYKHIRKDNSKVFYIGKGLKTRPFESRSRNIYWKNIVSKVGYEVKIISSDLTENEAFDLEALLIKLYKRYDMCEANLLIGDQRHGSSWSDPIRKEKLIERMKNNKYAEGKPAWNANKNLHYDIWNKGIPNTAETRLKISLANKGKETWNKGIPSTRDQKLKYAKSRGCRPFAVRDKETLEIVWQGLLQTEAIEFLGLNSSSKGNINMCLHGKRKSHKGYTFKYV